MRACVIGVGNRTRGDDGIGPRVIDALRERGANASLVVSDGDPAKMLDAWQGAERVVLVDAIHVREVPGTIVEFDAVAERLPRSAFTGSTHAFGVPEAVELARALDALPPSVQIIGVQLASIAHTEEMTPAVAAAVTVVADRVEALIASPNQQVAACTK